MTESGGAPVDPNDLGHCAASPWLTRRQGLLGLGLVGIGGASVAARAEASSEPAMIARRRRAIDIVAFGAVGDRRTDDFDAIQNAITTARAHDQYPASVFIPAGHYRRRAGIALPSHIAIYGEGPSSVLNSQNDAGFEQAVMVNADPAGLIAARLQDLSIYGGTHGILLQANAENADLRLQNVSMLLQTSANIEANKLFQTAKIANSIFGDAEYGLKVNGSGTNAVLITGSDFVRHKNSSIYLRGSDGVTFVGCRFEAGGRPGRACIDIENASNISFLGCFFENVHEYLGRFRSIDGAIVFQSCHFTGTSLGGKELRPFRWDAPDSLVLFRDCVSHVGMEVPGHVMLEGMNANVVATGALYSGNPHAGSVQAPMRSIAGVEPIPFAEIRGGPGWVLHLDLTLFHPSGERLSSNLPAGAAQGGVAIERAFDWRVVRSAVDRWRVELAPKALASSPWRWQLTWCAPTSIVPVVRALPPDRLSPATRADIAGPAADVRPWQG